MFNMIFTFVSVHKMTNYVAAHILCISRVLNRTMTPTLLQLFSVARERWWFGHFVG
jgi:hypothetical protein